MIEINLLPGGAKKRKGRAAAGGGGSLDVKAALAGLAGRVNDPYLIAAVASVVIAAAVVGVMYTTQTSREERLTAEQEQAVSDSTRFANYTKQRRRAEATRDTVLRQINIIRAIDGDRYLWPHVLDEVSRALPQYTWLTSLALIGVQQGTNTPLIVGNDSARANVAPPPGDAPAAKSASGVDTTIVRDEVKVGLEGQTVDIEAITRYMRQLEASPFIADVELGKSALTLVDNKEVTTFTLTMTYVRQDGDLIRRVPLMPAGAAPVTAGN